MIDLEGRVVLITGAGGAIGSATARTLAGAGATVLAHDVRAEAVEARGRELGPRGHALVSDLSDPAPSAASGRTRSRSTAGSTSSSTTPGSSPRPSSTRRSRTGSGSGTCRSASTSSRRRSCAGRPSPRSRPAGAAGSSSTWPAARRSAARTRRSGTTPRRRPGVVAMTRTIARRHGRQGVTAFAIAPGYVDTAFNKRFARRGRRRGRGARHGPGRGRPAAGRRQRGRVPGVRAWPATRPARRSTSTAPATSADRNLGRPVAILRDDGGQADGAGPPRARRCSRRTGCPSRSAACRR